MSTLRFRVVETAFKKKPVEVPTPTEHPSEYFGKYVFNQAKMQQYLSPDVYEQLMNVICNGAPLDRSIADRIAEGMKTWAVEMGATHYTHWFAPLTEGTAEKHDSFIEPDGKGGMIHWVFRLFLSLIPASLLIIKLLCSKHCGRSIKLPSMYVIISIPK